MMADEIPKFNLGKTVYKTLREAKFMCKNCQCPVMASWVDCPNCGNKGSTDR